MKNKDKKKFEQPSLNEEQIELFNAYSEKKNDDRSSIEPFDNSFWAKTKRYVKKHKTSAIVIIISAVSILVVLGVLLASAIIASINAPNKDDFKLVIGEKKYTVAYNDIFIDEMLYLDVNKLSAIDDIKISGTLTSRKFTLPNLQYVRFESDSDIAIVDGKYIQMSSKAIFKDDMCLVPYDFIVSVFNGGIVFDMDEEKNVIEIKRIELGKDEHNNIVYEPITISNDFSTSSDVAYKKYEIDLSVLEKWIDPTPSEEYLVLVNHDNPLPKTYIPNDLIQLTCATNPVNSDPSYYSLREVAEKSVTAMLSAMKKSGIDGIQVSSSYRSYARQEYLLGDYIDSKMKMAGLSYEEAKKEVQKTLAMPGHSEHQTGLSVDFVQGTKSLTNDFEKTSSFAWLKDNAHKFGFILRYPADKVSVTGYDYEPWHYRFVGRTVASRIYEAGVCYEEYIALTKQS